MSISMSAAEQRIRRILDEGSFVEIGSRLQTQNGLSDADGVITGSGSVNGSLVYVVSQDQAVLGGAVGQMHARKISSIYRLAVSTGAPVLLLIDSAGLRLGEEEDALFAFGDLLHEMASASGVIPQIMTVFGSCGGGMAAAASMADFVLMEKDGAKLFVSSPDAVIGNYLEKQDTSCAAFQTEETGIADFAGSEEELVETLRTLLAILPASNEEDLSETGCDDDLNRSVSGIEREADKAAMLSMLSDNSFLLEVKKEYASSAVTAFIRINGQTVGAVANESDTLDCKACGKIAGFVNFCDAFGIPVLTLADVKALARDEENERQLAAALGKLAFTYAKVTSPLVTVLTGDVYGTAALVMGSRSMGADMVLSWRGKKLGILPAGLMQKAGAVPAGGTAEYAAVRGYVDRIIDPAETRQAVAAAFDMLYTKNIAVPSRRHGTI